MCHDRRANAGNLQFSFALRDSAAAGKMFTLVGRQDCMSLEGLYFSVLHLAFLTFAVSPFDIYANVLKNNFLLFKGSVVGGCLRGEI